MKRIALDRSKYKSLSKSRSMKLFMSMSMSTSWFTAWSMSGSSFMIKSWPWSFPTSLSTKRK
jgi:hypothetical protein